MSQRGRLLAFSVEAFIDGNLLLERTLERGEVVALCQQASTRHPLRREEADQLLFSVRDRRIGIPPSEVEAVFERFWRGSNVAGRFSGTGIDRSALRPTCRRGSG